MTRSGADPGINLGGAKPSSSIESWGGARIEGTKRSRTENEAQIKGAKRLKIEGEALTERETREKTGGGGSVSPSPKFF